MPTTAQTARTQTTGPTTATTTAAPSSVAPRVIASSATPARSAIPAPPVMRLGGAAPKPVVVKQPTPFSKVGAGEPLAAGVRPALEERFGVDLSAVRVHTGADAAAAVGALSARAFTRGTDIFLGKGERATDFALLAHEVAHVVQQQGAPRVQRLSNAGSDACEREAHRASDAATHGEQFDVRERTTGTTLQRWGIGDALDRFADLANMIPGYRMFTIVLGVNPINMSAVERSAANIMRAVVEFIPGGGLVTRALDTYGVFERVGGWVEGQIRSLGMTGGAIRQALMDFVRSLSLSDIFDLGGVWDRARRIFTEPINRIISFARGLITGILGFLREAVLRPLAQLAQRTQGYDLLKAVLGQDPVTGEAVPRNADTLIGGFMKLIGQEEVWNDLKRANAVARAWAWFQGALEGLMGYVRQVPGLILSTLTSIVIEDLLPLTNLFVKVGRAFGGFFGSFLSWAGAQVMSLLQIIFEVVAPGVMPYIRRAAGAFTTIIRNPIGFVGNLVRAGIQGFRQFAGNFLNHLRASLISWLTGTMSGAGVYIPQAFSVMEIIKFVLSVLGLTWQNIRGKLVRAVGETAVRALEAGFDIVRTLVTQGPAAAWQKILEGITNLREMVMEQVMTFVRDRIVQAAITQLLTSLNPAGAFIQAIFAIYNTVMFFVERVRQIGQVVAAYIDSISAIAAGNIGAAANRVETTMAGLLTLVISFLARIARLGRVSDAVVNIVNRVRAPVDRALDRVVDWIVAQARRLGRFLLGGRQQPAPQSQPQPGEINIDHGVNVGTEHHTLRVQILPPRVRMLMASDGYAAFRERLQRLETRYRAIFNANPASANLAALLHTEVGNLVQESESLERQAENIRPPGYGQPSAVNQAQLVEAYRNALSNGLRSLEQKLDGLGKHFAFGGGQNVKVHDPILILSGSAPPVAAVVTQVGVTIRAGQDYRFGVMLQRANSNVAVPRYYEEYGTTWTISPSVPPIAPAVPLITSGNWRVMAAVGKPLNPAPTNPSQSIMPGGLNSVSPTSGKVYSQRGHLVANRFYGPNNDARNFVAMHTTANQGGMKVIENQVANLINTTGDIYKYEAQPLPVGQNPPDRIEVRITKIYPSTGAPITYGPVDNT